MGHGYTEAQGGRTRRHTPAKTRRRSQNLTPHEPHWVTPTDHQSPHRGRGIYSHRQRGIHPHRGPPRAPQNSPPHPNCQATTSATARATTQTQRHTHSRGKGTWPRNQGWGTTRRQRDGMGWDPTQPRGPRHPTPQNPAHPLGQGPGEDTGQRHIPQGTATPRTPA